MKPFEEVKFHFKSHTHRHNEPMNEWMKSLIITMRELLVSREQEIGFHAIILSE